MKPTSAFALVGVLLMLCILHIKLSVDASAGAEAQSGRLFNLALNISPNGIGFQKEINLAWSTSFQRKF